MLKQLQRLQLIDYRPATEEPQLTFIEERLDSKDLHIDREHLSLRKERYMERAHAMLRYVEDDRHCRSRYLLNYFGETAATRCGICDTCLERNKADLNDLEFASAEQKVIGMLKDRPVSLADLIRHLQPLDEAHALKIVEWMIDHGKIRYNGTTMLERAL
jgi:ATP-dependent DNA helicase RecQ